MRFRIGTCGLCKPTKRYKTNATRKGQRSKKEIQEEITNKAFSPIRFREINRGN